MSDLIVRDRTGRVYSQQEQAELTQLWAERFARGEFSAGVTGIGEYREMSQNGDEPLAYPVLATLEVLPTISREEQFVIDFMRAHVEHEVRSGRALLVGDLNGGGVTGGRQFNPTMPNHLMTIRTAGG